MHILRCMGSKFLTHIPQNKHFAVFYFCVWVTISLNCDVISLSETGPRMYLTNHNGLLYMSRQCYFRDVCKITSWSAEYVMFKSTTKLHSISNSVGIPLVGRPPDLAQFWYQLCYLCLQRKDCVQKKNRLGKCSDTSSYCPACRTYLIATRFWVVVICPIIKCLTVLEFSFILFDLCLFITIFNFILNYVPIVTFWISTYHKIWILLITFCFIWNYWIIYFSTCLEVFWSVVN